MLLLRSEKVIIPPEEPFIILEGETVQTTVIQWGDAGVGTRSSTFSLFAENFVARDLSFKVNFLMFFFRKKIRTHAAFYILYLFIEFGLSKNV